MEQFIWEEFLKILKQEAGIQIVETWFKAVSFQQWNSQEKTVTLQFPNQFVCNWIQEHYYPLIKTHLCRLLHVDSVKISFVCKNMAEGEKRNIIPASIIQEKHTLPAIPFSTALEKPASSKSTELVTKESPENAQKNRQQGLNPAYLFETFIVGPSNSLAHAAAYAVSQNLGKAYNPLFIYGGTGLGKTHLLHSIGNEVKKRKPKTVIRYETADHFMQEFITSIRFDKCHLFREKYQKVDLLLLDDIQFLSNKEQTQEAFFHIFNVLHQRQKQIILSSDTFPKEITGLQNRLKSRMEWGLIADIQTPDLETKIAILKKKAESQALKLNDDVAFFIASRIVSNIRALEGALVRAEAFASLTNQPLTLDLAKQVLLNLPEKKNDNLVFENILKIIAKHFAISTNDLRSKTRQKDVVYARQVAFFLMKKHTVASLQTIGSYIGGRDHSTVIHAIMKVESCLQSDKTLYQKVRAIEQDLVSC